MVLARVGIVNRVRRNLGVRLGPRAEGENEVAMLLDRFCSRAQRSGLKPFVTAAKTIRKRKEGIDAAVRLKINNARHEGLNRRVRLIVNRAYDFHSAKAALGLIMLTLGPIEDVLPYERVPVVDP